MSREVHARFYERLRGRFLGPTHFLIGVIGSKEDAEQVKTDVRVLLAEKLKLRLSDNKTKVTHSSDRARFLGYDITVSRRQVLKNRKTAMYDAHRNT